jgi:putative nucleotidyltransferase with HDIG domain
MVEPPARWPARSYPDDDLSMDEAAESPNRFVTRLGHIWAATRVWFIVLMGVLGTIAAISIPLTQQDAAVGMQVGDVAPRDLLAPQDLTYASDILTEQARAEAAADVPEQYTAPDSQVARHQIENLRSTLDFVDAIRADPYASQAERLNDMRGLDSVNLDPEISAAILEMSAPQWDMVKQDSLDVLEQVMRREIRPSRVEEFIRGVPAWVDMSLGEQQSQVVAALVRPFVQANTELDAEATESQREAARLAVEPVLKTFSQGETIVERGEVVTDQHLEALRQFGMLQASEPWKGILIRGVLVILLASVLVLFAHRTDASMFQNPRMTAALSTLFILLALAMQAVLPDRAVLPYLFPFATVPLLMAVLFGPGMGVMTAFIIGGLAGFLAPSGLELALYASLGGMLAALVIGRAERLSAFFWAGLGVSLSCMVVVAIFRFLDPATDIAGKATLLGAGLLSGVVSAILAVGMLLPLGNILGVVTSLQLIELSRPDHPLLQLLLQNAPGTYQHSLQVANLAEQAAREIGANALLTRVGALYHDVGKALQPQFFIENQVTGVNAHDQLDPATSAGVILSHVYDGLDLARKHRLPRAIQNFITEHHGNLRTSYQYNEALNAAGGDLSKVDERNYQYPGPRPHSAETALVMLADGVEAKARADAPGDPKGLNTLVGDLIRARLNAGQLDKTDLTLKDLDTIRRSFVKSLKGIYHPRIRYPQLKKPAVETGDAAHPLPQTQAGP